MRLGSSPLTRGKRRPEGEGRCRCGLIPAHAGKTSSSWKWPKSWTAHPRSRGENAVRWVVMRAAAGSSPLTRGKPALGHTQTADKRLIPAHAGKTRVRPGDLHERRAHPRSRGENLDAFPVLVPAHGSSPLTRGKPALGVVVEGGRGLIPAHAGKTLWSWSPLSSARAHPRSRGENAS